MSNSTLQLTILPFEATRMSQICTLSGEFDKAGMDSIGTRLQELITNFKGSYFIFDLERLSFINSEGVGLLISAYTHATNTGAKFFIIHASSQIRDILQALGLWTLVGHADSVEACYVPPSS